MARSKKSSKAKKKSSVTVDMEGVESGGRSIEDGWAHGRIKSAELTESSNENEMFKIVWEAKRGKEKALVYDNVVLIPNSLWKLKQLLEACGVDVPEGEMDVSEDDLVDLECEIDITNEEYEGKDRPKVTGYRPLESDDEEEDEDEDEEEEDDEEEPPKKSKKAKKASKEDEDDEDEEEDEDDDDDDDEEDEDDEDEDDDDEDEEDEAEKPKKGKKSKSKLRAGMRVTFEDDKGKTKKGVITSVDDDTVYVEDKSGAEWELSPDEIQL